jgi:cytochrome P450
MLRDENIYKNPGTFIPERFLKDGKLDPDVRSPEVVIFGFGRRYGPHSATNNGALTCIKYCQEMSWQTPTAFNVVLEHCLYIGDVRHRKGY